MALPHLSNHLRANRKRLALSQDELAYLLGTRDGAKVSRYERFNREPSFHTALAYEAVFQRPIREIFPGLYEQIKGEVAERAKRLSIGMNRLKATPEMLRKREALAVIAKPKPITP